jgi:hypothetical protein
MTKRYEVIGVLTRSYGPTYVSEGYQRRKHRFKLKVRQYIISETPDGERLYHLRGLNNEDGSYDSDGCSRFESLFKSPYFAEMKHMTV